MKVWVGGEAMLGMFAVGALVAYFVAYEIVMFYSMFKNAAGMWGPDRFRPAISGIANILLSILLVQVMGANGVVLALALTTWAISVTWITRNTFSYVLKTPFSAWGIEFLKYILLIVACAILSYLCCDAVPMQGVLGLLVKLLIAFIASALVFLIPSLRNAVLLDALIMVDSATKGRLAFPSCFIRVFRRLNPPKEATSGE